MTWVEIPFQGGQREDTDPALLPNGALTTVRNLRMAKTGRLAKRWPFDNLSIFDGGGTIVPSLPALSLNAAGDSKLLVTRDPVRLYNVDTDRGTFGPDTAETPGGYYLGPTFAAAERDIVCDVLGESSVDSASCRGITVIAVADTSGNAGTSPELTAYVYSGDVLLASESLHASASIKSVQVVALENTVVVGYLASSSGSSAAHSVVLRELDCSASTGTPSFGSATVIGVTNTNAGRMSLQVLEPTPSRLYAAWNGVTGITNQARYYCADEGSLGTPISSGGITDVAGALNCNIYADSSDLDRAWLVWVNEAASTCKAQSFTDATLGTTDTAFTVTSASGVQGTPRITRASDSPTVWVAVQFSGSSSLAPPVVLYECDTSAADLGRATYGAYMYSHFARPDSMQLGASSSSPGLFAAPSSVSSLVRGSLYFIAPPTNEYDAESTAYLRLKIAENALYETPSTQAPGHIYQDANGDWGFAASIDIENRGLVVARWRFRDDRYDLNQFTSIGRGQAMTGGIVSYWDGVRLSEYGHHEPPHILSLTPSAGAGSLSSSSEYSYIAIAELEHADGRVSLGPPGLPASVDLGGTDNTVDLVIRASKTRQGFSLRRLRIYRTLADGSVYYYVATVPDPSWVASGQVSYTDLAPDAAIATNHELYTQAGAQLDNDPPPPCRYLARCGDRLWVAGLEEPDRVRCSKRFFPGELPSFPAVEEYSVVAPAKVIGLGSLASTPVLFTRRNIVAVVGQGPDDAGNGSFQIREIPSDSGLDEHGHRSIVETTIGLFYRSPEGIFLLPPGFGPPLYIGEPIRDSLASYPYITSAVVVDSAQEVRFTAVDSLTAPSAFGLILVFDLRTRTWLTHEVDTRAGGGLWGGQHVVVGSGATSHVSLDLGSYSAGPVGYVSSVIETGDIRAGSVSRYGSMTEVQLLVEYRDQCKVQIELSNDGGRSYPYTQTYDLAAGGYTAGDLVTLDWKLPSHKGTRHRLRITDLYSGKIRSEAVVYLGLAVNLYKKDGGARVRAAQRS